MLYKYILNKDKITEYFPETKEEYTDNTKTTVLSDLVSIYSNRWIDIKDEDKYIPLVFKMTKELSDHQEELMVKYIEKLSSVKNVHMGLIKKLGLNSCEYRCFIGDSILYVSEKNSYDIKNKIKIFQDSFFLSIDPNCSAAYPESKELDGIWYTSKKINPTKYTIENYHIASQMLDIKCDDEGIFHNINCHQKEMLQDIGNKKLPSVRVGKRKIIGLVKKLISLEDPLYTPVKIRECLKRGKIHFYDARQFFDILSEVKDEDVKTILTKHPIKHILTMRENEIPYVYSDNYNDDSHEIIYSSDKKNIEESDLDIDGLLSQACDNMDDIKEHDDFSKLDCIIEKNKSVCIKQGDMIYLNPYDKKLIPFSYIHTASTYKNGLDIDKIDYRPHKSVKLNIPVEVVVDNIDDNHISITLKTNKEEQILYEKVKMKHRPGDIELLKTLIKKLWQKGYFLNDYGLACAHYYGKYIPGCIEKPWWFLPSEKNDINNLMRFISSST